VIIFLLRYRPPAHWRGFCDHAGLSLWLTVQLLGHTAGSQSGGVDTATASSPL
jgi:hypothetical protein